MMNGYGLRLLGALLISLPVAAIARAADELTDPVEILKRADEAAKKVQAVEYDVVAETSGGPQALHIEGTYLLSGKNDGPPKKYRIEAQVKTGGSEEAKKVTIGGDGENYYVVLHADKKVHEDIDPNVIGTTGRTIFNGLMLEFLYSKPFSDEINGKERKLLGSKKVGDEDCYEIHVVYGQEGAPDATWCFSKKDFLPRSRVDQIKTPSGEMREQRKTITRLIVDPKTDEDAFKLKMPEGFTKTDEFAP